MHGVFIRIDTSPLVLGAVTAAPRRGDEGTGGRWARCVANASPVRSNDRATPGIILHGGIGHFSRAAWQ